MVSLLRSPDDWEWLESELMPVPESAVPAAGLLGTIAGVVPTISSRLALIVLLAATIVVALFAQSGRADVYLLLPIDRKVIETARWVLRRKEAWARLASYLAFFLAVFVAIAAAAS